MDEEKARIALVMAANAWEELRVMYAGQDYERRTTGEIGSQHRDKFEAFLDTLVDAAMTALGS